MDLVDQLAEHKTLKAAPRKELEWLAAHGTIRHLAEGDVVASKGQTIDSLIVILAGHAAIFVDCPSGPYKMMEWHGGDVTGLLPYSRMGAAPGVSAVDEPSTILAVHRDCFPDMIRECPSITAILVHTMVDRARVFTSSDLQEQKMASLGKLSAGLAHELNNPVSAIERSAALLEDRLDDVDRATRAIGAARLSDAQLVAFDRVRATCLLRQSHGVLSPIQQAEREDSITDWLTDHGVDTAIAGPLAETSVTLDALNKIAEAVSGPALDAVLRWTAAGCSVRGIASEIQEAAMRISGLVAAVKGFTHMDQASVAEPLDLAVGVNNTVAVLRAKARTKSVAIAVKMPSDLPRVRGFAGELNQIWANLLDNALDAVHESGHVELSAIRERQRVVVRVVDDGSGIPPDVRQHLFEPFYTTKPVGKGTGLGLDIVRRLVNHNDASIEVESQPGRTEFRVSLPIADNETAAVPA